MKSMNSSFAVTVLALLLLLSLAGCDKERAASEKILLDWGNALNLHLATGGTAFSYPRNGLEEIDESLTAGLSTMDAWGKEIYYRRLRDDRYQLISAGPDGQFGNEDDVVLENGALYDAAQAYAKKPLDPADVP